MRPNPTTVHSRAEPRHGAAKRRGLGVCGADCAWQGARASSHAGPGRCGAAAPQCASPQRTLRPPVGRSRASRSALGRALRRVRRHRARRSVACLSAAHSFACSPRIHLRNCLYDFADSRITLPQLEERLAGLGLRVTAAQMQLLLRHQRGDSVPFRDMYLAFSEPGGLRKECCAGGSLALTALPQNSTALCRVPRRRRLARPLPKCDRERPTWSSDDLSLSGPSTS